jgi:uncharacterized protein YdiU (UPF0061 family)
MTAGEKAKAKYLKLQAYKKEYNSQYYQLNKEKHKAYQAEWIKNMTPEQREKHKAYHREYQRKYRKMKKAKRNYFQKAQKVEPKKYPKVDPNNEEYRDVMRAAAKAYRALSADEKLERIRIAYKNR